MKRVLHPVLLTLFTLLVPVQARADACGGASPFLDIAQNDSFCADATWARNANITLGCGNGNFCPFDNVTRAQMVLFLRRMAEATFPGQVFAESTAAPQGDLDTGVNACTTGAIAIPAGGNLRFAHVHAVVSLRSSGSADVQISAGHSIDGGPFTPNHTVNQVVTAIPGEWANASVIVALVPIFPGTSNRWRVDLARAGAATIGELSDLRCQIKVLTHMAAVPPF